MCAIGVYCTFTNLNGNGVHLNSAEGRLPLIKLPQHWLGMYVKAWFSLVDQYILYSYNTKLKH